MDRALKERTIGAVVLVAIIVLVVPVFLDGPTPKEEMISEPVILPGQSREPGARRTVVLQRDRDRPLPDAAAQDDAAPVEAAASNDTAPVETAASNDTSARGTAEAAPLEREQASQGADDASGEPVVAAETPKPEPAPAREEPAAAPATSVQSATGMWAVQLGSFSNKANADRLATNLREDGYAAFLSRHRTASGELHRVRIGPQEDRASAEAVAARLSADGFKGQVVPHP